MTRPAGNWRHGHASLWPRRKSPTYESWVSMKTRVRRDPFYLGQGITVCDRWATSFRAFLADMGERPAGKTLDRVEPTGPYVPDNCRWATPTEQAGHRRPRRDSLTERTHCTNGHDLAEVGTIVSSGRRRRTWCRACQRDNTRRYRQNTRRHATDRGAAA